jgi:WD40 repeat protein
LWDTSTWRELRRLHAEDGSVSCLGFSADGKILAGAGRSQVELWDPDSGRMIRRFGQRPDLDISPGRRFPFAGVLVSRHGMVVAVTHNRLLAWDTTTGKEVIPGNRSEWVTGPAALSPDNKTLAAYQPSPVEAFRGMRQRGEKGVLCFWETVTGQERARFPLFAADCDALAFAPDNRLLASGHADGAIRVWDTASGKELHKWAGHAGPISHLAWSADGRVIVSASDDSTLLVWDATAVLSKSLPPSVEGGRPR